MRLAVEGPSCVHRLNGGPRVCTASMLVKVNGGGCVGCGKGRYLNGLRPRSNGSNIFDLLTLPLELIVICACASASKRVRVRVRVTVSACACACACACASDSKCVCVCVCECES
jgi:hypothetical protein